MKPGFFITFEGIEGCGKTSQLKLAAQWLEQQGHKVCRTREPGGTELGIHIRKLLLSETSSGLAPLSEALLYMADRFQHINEVIRPALEAGQVVLCDRYHDSTIAYQGYARKISLNFLDAIWKNSGSVLEPHLTLLLDLEPKSGIERSLQKLEAQQIDESRFEKETLEFHTRVRDGFLTLARENPGRIHVVDANRSIDDVHKNVVEVIAEFFNRSSQSTQRLK
ncbi:dTMP kinase [bacterium]|nr:dTMP kinase [bacterium]MCI0602837.1 dTMP kinase [bacterium]